MDLNQSLLQSVKSLPLSQNSTVSLNT